MASSYPAYAGRQAPLSDIPYSGVSPNPMRYPYPPNTSQYDASTVSFQSDDSHDHDAPYTLKTRHEAVSMREISRTPSPTPSELEELRKPPIDWKAMANWRFWIRREWLWYYAAFFIATVALILFTVYHEQIVNFLKPAATWMHNLPYGWTIPIGIMFVISFPPLFGQEIVAILCGLVWGLWEGFGIVAAGTFLGELGNFYAFKYCCSARGEKLERTDTRYACLARVVRDGGFKIALIARFSAIPGHFTTAVFSTCGMSVWTFSIAAILSLPKQLVTVYLGVALEQSETGSSTRDKIVKDAVLAGTTIITFVAMWYIYKKMNDAKPLVIHDRRKARQAKLAMSSTGDRPYGGNGAVLQSTASVVFNPNVSDAEIPLTAHQQWDKNGRAIGYAADPILYVPKPQRAPSRAPAEVPLHRPEQRNELPPSGYPTNERARARPSSPPARNAYLGVGDTSPFAPPERAASPALQNPFEDPTKVQVGFSSRVQSTYLHTPPASPVSPQGPPAPYPASQTLTPAQFAAYQQGGPARAPQPMTYTQPYAPAHAYESAGAPYQTAHAHAPAEAYPHPYDSTTSVQSQAGSLPPSYSNSSLR
ncbi:hypothetical protein OBBRIDRAFT_797454 [Obba rivulosa]|uniref:Golgi apparatus membrane protein TVP38 n=1 Tax=Obba rivulosa TaxID=1052685 RepID=A0A8E2AKB7_9APHY|nr:hypothetical protein OBBRIDRAFT_797454 [Obba rivulosa]